MRIEGRQILNSEDIEKRASQLLQVYNPDFFKYVHPTPLMAISSFLEKKYGIIFRFDASLGFSEGGQRILGAFNPKKKVVLIDESLKQDIHQFNFTLAHELGHLALHRHIKIIHDGSSEEIDETINERPGEKKIFKTELDWVEWQANYYASALLMPKDIFSAGLIMIQREIGISRVGKIFIDDQRTNQLASTRIVTRLSEYFQASKTAVEFRLQKLRLIDDQRGGRYLRDIITDLGI